MVRTAHRARSRYVVGSETGGQLNPVGSPAKGVTMTSGVPAERLSDEELRHDLLQLKNKQADIEAEGTPDQQANHRSRTAELEAEFVRRFGSSNDDGAADSDQARGTDPAGQDG